ncbi:hypothetical protein [Enterococcus diestrammenae]|uniref:hypothetical protein n=1 Tax=Enterococcus diestrammenae TaxID=1155073 RepID=UPI0022E85AFC|nr:hypothetical protein [Enterococcus diestrammenae]
MNEELLKAIKDLRDTKNIDEIADLFYKITAMYGLTVAEVAAINYYLMKRAFETPINQEWFRNNMKLDVSDLSIEGTLKVQEALVNVYVGELMKND